MKQFDDSIRLRWVGVNIYVRRVLIKKSYHSIGARTSSIPVINQGQGRQGNKQKSRFVYLDFNIELCTFYF